MKKGLLALMATASLVTTTLSAEENWYTEAKGFIGIEGGQSKISATGTTATAFNTDTSDFESEIGIRLGAVDEDWRATLAVWLRDNPSGTQLDRANLAIDYYFLAQKMEFPLQPFIGAHAGYMGYKSNVAVGGSTELFEQSGPAYGVQVGATLDLDIVSFDLGYRHSLTNLSQTLSGGDVKVDSLGSYYLALDLRF